MGVAGPPDLKWLAVAKSGGSLRPLMYRGVAVWNPDTRTRRTVQAADVTVTDSAGTRVVKVGAQVTSLPFR